MHRRYQYVVLFCCFKPCFVYQNSLYLFPQRTQYSFVTCADGYKLLASGYQMNVDGRQIFNVFIPTKDFGRPGPLNLRVSTTNSHPSASQLSEAEDGIANVEDDFLGKTMNLYYQDVLSLTYKQKPWATLHT